MNYTTINHAVDTTKERAALEAMRVAARRDVVANTPAGNHEAVVTLVASNRRYVRYVVTRTTPSQVL
jgi:hypothetical protein